MSELLEIYVISRTDIRVCLKKILNQQTVNYVATKQTKFNNCQNKSNIKFYH